MKKLSNTRFPELSYNRLQSLTTIVKETIAPGFSNPGSRPFTTADLWNIRCQGRGSAQRRFI